MRQRIKYFYTVYFSYASLFILFACAFLFYSFFGSQTIQWSDAAKFQLYTLEEPLWPPLIQKHTGFLFLCKIWHAIGSEDPAWMHRLSSLGGAFGVLFLYLLLEYVHVERSTRLIVTVLFALSHTYWFYSSFLETYSWALALYLFYLLETLRQPSYVRWFLESIVILTFAYLLHIALLLGLGFLFFCRTYISLRKNTMRFAYVVSILFIAGLLFKLYPYKYDLLYVVQTYVHPEKFFRQIIKFIFYLMYQIPSPFILLIPLGISRMYTQDRKTMTFIALPSLLYLILGASYMYQRQFALFLFTYVAFFIFLAYGFHPLSTLVRKYWVLILCLLIPYQFAVYTLSPFLVEKTPLSNLLHIRDAPFRDEYHYFLTPWKRWDKSALLYARASFNVFSENAHVLADFNPGMVLKIYKALYRPQSSVKIYIEIDNFLRAGKKPPYVYIQQWISEHCRASTVFLADTYDPYYFISKLKLRFKLVSMGPVVKVECQ